MNLLEECSREIIKDGRPVLLATSVSPSIYILSPNYSQLYAATSNDNHHANEQYCNKNNAEVREIFTSNKTVTTQILIWNVLQVNEYNFINEKETYNSNHSFTLLNEKPVAHILKYHQGVIMSCNFDGNSEEYLALTIDVRKLRLWKRSELPINDVDSKQTNQM